MEYAASRRILYVIVELCVYSQPEVVIAPGGQRSDMQQFEAAPGGGVCRYRFRWPPWPISNQQNLISCAGFQPRQTPTLAVF